MRFGYFITLLALMGCAAISGMGSFEPARHLYPYGSYVHQFQAEQAATIEKVVIHSQETTDSPKNTIHRRGILVKYPQAKATIVICHGFMCDKFDVGFVRQLFPKGKFNFLTFDFRGHGEDSKGQCCTFGKEEALDVIAAAKFVKSQEGLKDLPVYVYGFSMGAVASIEAQAKEPGLFKAMILDCPFDSSENVVKKALDNLKVSLFGYEFEIPGKQLLERYAFHPYVQEFVKGILKTVAHMDAKNIQTYIYRFSPAESIKMVDVPCMFIHCKEDKRVPVAAIHNIYKGAQGSKILWVTNGRGHYDSIFFDPEQYSKRISKFFDQVISGELHKNKVENVIEDSDEEQVVLNSGA